VVASESRRSRAGGLLDRARAAATAEERAGCLIDVEAALRDPADLMERAHLLMVRARLHANQGHLSLVVEDAVASMALFEELGEADLAVDAASFAAACASRVGQVSRAAELATKTVVGLDSIEDDRLITQITNDLGAFCYSLLDYEQAARQCEKALAAAERAGDQYHVCGQLHNIADILLRSVLVDRARNTIDGSAPSPDIPERLQRAERMVRRLLAEAPPDVQVVLGAQRVQAELLLETGHPAEALEVIEQASRGEKTVYDSKRAAFALVESRCLSALGRHADAVEAAHRAVRMSKLTDDDHEIMVALDQRSSARLAAGDLAGAMADTLEAKARIWAIHQRQTAQVVEEVWTRAALERERRHLEERTAAAVRSSEEDPLTRIGNRRGLEHFLARAGDAPIPISVVMVDIDHFKKINDTFGHELGDLVLCSLAELFEAETRAGQMVARYGGEEFVFVVLGADLGPAASFAERVRVRVTSYNWAGLDARLQVTISLGVSSGKLAEWRAVLTSADAALYTAKRLGRNRVEVASLSLGQNVG
jgi:diguanylate cyclase (GGDEF)-like protein